MAIFFNESICSMDQTKNGSKSTMETREFIANNKRFTIDNNSSRSHLRIVGNGNKIDLKSNSGYLDVVGNSTRVKIAENTGKVNYTGNSGKIYFGSSSETKAFNYSGTNGTIKVINKDDIWKNTSTSGEPSKDQKKRSDGDFTNKFNEKFKKFNIF